MATNEDLPRIEIQTLADDEEQTYDEKEEESHASINYTSYGEELQNTPWLKLHKLTNPIHVYTKVRSKFKNCRCCLWSSKAVILILVWNLIISIGFKSFFDPSFYTVTISKSTFNDDDFYYDYTSVLTIYGLSYGMNALLLVFCPLAGFLADVRWGRYTTVKNSLCFLFWSIVLISVLAGLALLGSTPLWFISYSTTQTITVAMLFVVFGLPVLSGAILFLCSIIAFNANVIQFGLDQLHDAPAESLKLYIHWYVWTNQVGLFLLRLPSAYASSPVLVILALILLGVTLCLERYKRRWFLIEPGSANPYKLVYKVLRFAKDHTNPVRRSAFTYCENELPSRLDLGKEKYGGPFTTEQVEDVKAFIGILCVLLTLGPVVFADVAFSENLPGLVRTYSYDYYFNDVDVPSYAHFYGSGCLTPLLMLILIPLYLCLFRPLIQDHIPGILKRMGLGMVLCSISGLCTLVMSTINRNCARESCKLTYFNISPHFLLIQFTLNALSYLLLYIASYEFVCAQSPHSMKGLLIGTFFAIKGSFQLFGVVLYSVIGTECNVKFGLPVCTFTYYFINIVIALIGLIAFVLVARKYQYRQRDEPDNIYRYAEEYYANAQDETSYGYDNDDDNLNVETIQN